MSSGMMCNAALKFDVHPKYDEEYLTIEEHILINLEIIVINNLLAGVRTAEANQIDFDAELKYIASWLEKPKDGENDDCVFDREPIMFAGAVEIDTLTLLTHEPILQNSTAQNTADCRQAWMSITNFAEFVEPEGRSRTAEVQSNNRMHYTSMCKDFKLSNWKSRKRENINKYYLTATKVKMKKMEDCRVQGLEL